MILVFVMMFALVACGSDAENTTDDATYMVALVCDHSGYMAGYAVQRFGYGFVQGADAAATEPGIEATLKYAYGNQGLGAHHH